MIRTRVNLIALFKYEYRIYKLQICFIELKGKDNAIRFQTEILLMIKITICYW